MNKNKIITIIRVALGLISWFLVFKLYGAFIDPLLADKLPDVIRMILTSMVIPYTLGLGAFCLVVTGIPRVDLIEDPEIKPSLRTIVRFFVIQTGLSFPVMVAVSIFLNIAGVKPHSLTYEDLFGHFWFYIVLLLIFNPIFEEILFRKFILERLSCLGPKGAIICSAMFFALPHVYSQGLAQMFYTFALGLVWAYLTVKTGKLWPAIVLHALSNLYCAYIPILATSIHPALSGFFVMITLSVMIPLTIVFIMKQVGAKKDKIDY